MKTYFLLFLAVTCLFQFGCATRSNIFPDKITNITPLTFTALFNLNVNIAKDDSKTPFSIDEDQESIGQMWQEVTKNYAINSQKPEYTFDLSLLYTKSYVQRQSWSPKYFSSAIFELKSYDKDHKLINSELFKIIGMWHDGVGSLSGPVNVSAFNWAKTTRQAIIKLGFLDILAHVADGTFAEKNSQLHKITHFRQGTNFEFRPFDVISQKLIADLLPGTPTTYYNTHGAGIIYLNFIMAENYKTVDDIRSSIWPDGSTTGILEIVAKLAHDKSWPLFPKKLDVSTLPYSFE